MPGFTVPLAFPYPLPADPTDGPGAIQALAEAVDLSVTSTTASALAALSPPSCKVTGGAQNIPNATSTRLQFNTVVYDNNGIADLVSNPFEVVIRTTGIYIFTCDATFAPNTAGVRTLDLQQAAVAARFQIAPSPSALLSTSMTADVTRLRSVGDLIGVNVTQTSGVALAVTSCTLTMVRISS